MNQTVLFGERLRELRALTGLNQSDFAKICGVTKKTQMLYESGERVPDATYLQAMDAKGISACYFLTGTRDWLTQGDVSLELNADEQNMIKAYRAVSKIWRDIALSILQNGEKQLRSQPSEKIGSFKAESTDS